MKARLDLKTILYRAAFKKRFRAAPARPIVTFCFDDFPRSAFEAGAPVLESRGARATFYACAGLMASGARPKLATPPMLVEAIARGHEVANHTFTHPNLRDLPSARIVEQLRRNQEALPPGATRHFAYPFGAGDTRVEWIVSRLAPTARSCVPGINAGLASTHWLRANELYACNDPARPLRLIEENRRRKGWLIFFTHGVSAAPGPYDATPDLLAATLDAALTSGAEVLPVDAAWRRIRRGD
ncbi:polysaccharide deacetylase family protein [Oceanicella actignis]|uniref:Chitooligosaccharide deacetylase n=1 Tax=Oceanicella actignis TaxID=1189325 RepID=A0A1M7T4N0_9RHOB|nr:polysaccharide deacetylase family protein [Oceanicella actignis]SET42039.1 Polysaccharide deacetylase [Oceanicella actignis]SHN65690.1 Polysaccharide deacetylase [Oceanicella actignis]